MAQTLQEMRPEAKRRRAFTVVKSGPEFEEHDDAWGPWNRGSPIIRAVGLRIRCRSIEHSLALFPVLHIKGVLLSLCKEKLRNELLSKGHELKVQRFEKTDHALPLCRKVKEMQDELGTDEQQTLCKNSP